jgi:hypothetical protein
VMLCDPAAIGELADDRAIELTPRREVDVLDARLRESKLCILEYAAQVMTLERNVGRSSRRASTTREHPITPPSRRSRAFPVCLGTPRSSRARHF